MHKKITKVIALILSLLLIFEQSGFAQITAQLDISAHLAALRQSLTPDRFRPLHLRYLQYNPQENTFQLLLDKGDLARSQVISPKSQVNTIEDQTKKLLNYFFIGVSLPNSSFWVNLRPDSPDNIIDPLLAQTDIGKVFLEADLQLKKDTAQFTSPQTLEGKAYWDKLYKKAEELFSAEGGSAYGGGYENITIPTLTRPWIVPGEIIVREAQDNAYIYKATLKVMLEQDYLEGTSHKSQVYITLKIQG